MRGAVARPECDEAIEGVDGTVDPVGVGSSGGLLEGCNPGLDIAQRPCMSLNAGIEPIETEFAQHDGKRGLVPLEKGVLDVVRVRDILAEMSVPGGRMPLRECEDLVEIFCGYVA